MELPDDDVKMLKHNRSIDYIKRHCGDIYFCGINCAFVGYNKNGSLRLLEGFVRSRCLILESSHKQELTRLVEW